jgi:hypothetical protein
MLAPRPPLASSLDDYIAKVSRLIRRRSGARAFTEITIIIQDGTPVRLKETKQATFEELVPENF